MAYTYSSKCEYCKASPTELIYTCEACAKGRQAANYIARVEHLPPTRYLPYAYLIAVVTIVSQILAYWH